MPEQSEIINWIKKPNVGILSPSTRWFCYSKIMCIALVIASWAKVIVHRTQRRIRLSQRFVNSIRFGGNFRAWLARITTNTCYDELRKRKRRPQDYLEELPGAEMYDEAPIAADSPTPEQEAQRADLNQAIQDCITALNDDQRIVMVMSDVQGYSYQEIADMVDTSLGTVKSRLSRARLAVRRCLQAVQELLPHEYRLSSED